MRHPICLPLLLVLGLPLAAQADPGFRRDATSVGLGYGTQGPTLTFMRTGPTFGYFSGFGLRPDSSSYALESAGDGTPRWIQHQAGTHEIHLGMAYRLDDRWVLGAGLGFAATSYDYTYNPGANPSPYSGPPPAPGPLTDHRFGPVGMVDLRLGTHWGLEVVGGVIGMGVTLTRRF